jgi:hypothetical protein
VLVEDDVGFIVAERGPDLQLVMALGHPYNRELDLLLDVLVLQSLQVGATAVLKSAEPVDVVD